MNLVYLAEYFGLPEVATFWNEVVKINNWHQHRISKLIIKKLFGTLSGKKIAVLGFAFKKDTNDTRESAAIQICKDLLDEGSQLIIHDPKVSPEQISNDLGLNQNSLDSIKYPGEGNWCFADEVEDALIDADAALIVTEWPEYTKINWNNASRKMRKPAWVFDSRSIIDPKDIDKEEINFWRVGDGLN